MNFTIIRMSSSLFKISLLFQNKPHTSALAHNKTQKQLRRSLFSVNKPDKITESCEFTVISQKELIRISTGLLREGTFFLGGEGGEGEGWGILVFFSKKSVGPP